MAIIKLNGVITRISGKMQGIVFGFSTNGSYIKSNAFSLPQFSEKQTIVQKQIQLISSLWQSLTLTQKNTFQSEVGNYTYINKVGDVANYNAYQIFLYINNNRVVQGLAPLVSCPAYVPVFAADYTFDTLSTTQMLVESLETITGHSTVFYLTASLPITRQPKASEFKLIDFVSHGDFPTTIDLFAAYVAVFGSPVAGLNIWMRSKEVSNTTGITSVLSTTVFSVVS